MTLSRLDTLEPGAQEELTHRRATVREAVASATIEGGDVGPAATRIMEDWAAGRIDKAIMLERVLRLDEPG